ncbi:26462_t:CDS:2 [Dentiscutata erythropus]|uniref:26462_t:CDS:1 n=1 Tax=Dentiscutata erythropus TaxID=1348616 RepID=A0A9N8VVY3_9GLOM|nr:26462_t:CDS:2 [Dentiscutata erythropus]
MNFITQYVPEHPEDSYEDVVKAFQESQGQEKVDTDSRKLINFMNEEEEIVRKAFDRAFQDPSDLSERFMLFINKCSREYKMTKDYYAPYTTLIQASGTGKSKLLKNFAENIMSVYCCLRDFKSSGYPSRSYIANTLLREFENERDAIVTYLAYICTCFQKLQEFNGSRRDWIDEHTNKNSQVDFWKDVEYRITDITRELMKNPTDSEMAEGINKYLYGEKTIKQKGSVKCLFAFDEARTMVNKKVEKETLFYYIRRALKLIHKKSRGRGVSLFELFYLLDTVDINTDFKQVPILKDSEDPQHFFQYGRSLWGALLSPSSETKEFKPERIIELAMDKLIGGKSFILWKKESQNKISIMESLAILGSHLYIDIVPQSRYTSHLIASYMHLCLDISEDHVCFTELINQLSSALKKGVVETGYCGELTARLLLLKAWDDCNKKKHPSGTDLGNDYSHFMTINEFLRSLLADNIYEKIKNRLEESTLCEQFNEDRISYILIQDKNWSTHNKGDNYLLYATAFLSPAYTGIEELPHMPFLSLYLQLGATTEFIDIPKEFVEMRQTRQVISCKRKIKEVLKDYKTDNNETRKEFFKKIRIDYEKEVSGAEITAFREHFQISLGLFGLSLNVYNCLEQFTPVSTTSSSASSNNLTNSLKHLLSAWVNPAIEGNQK